MDIERTFRCTMNMQSEGGARAFGLPHEHVLGLVDLGRHVVAATCIRVIGCHHSAVGFSDFLQGCALSAGRPGEETRQSEQTLGWNDKLCPINMRQRGLTLLM